MKNAFASLEGNGVSVFYYDIIDSTNSQAKRACLSGVSAPALFVADAQSGGRGRMGRSFFSPPKTGIYLTVLIDAPCSAENSLKLTSAAAVAVRRAIFQVTGISTKIKWVNDIYLGDRKIAGILAESFPSPCSRKRCVALGVGINLFTEDFPEELKSIAGSLMNSSGFSEAIRPALAARTAQLLFELLADPDQPSIMEEYREHSAVLGKRVRFYENGIAAEGIALSIDNNGALLAQKDNGETVALASGEISLRLSE